MTRHNSHDRGYKYLFSHPDIVQELLESFVDMEWVSEVDFSQAELLSTSFVSEEFRYRESDVIYRLPLKERDLYIYLLIELQSTVDPLMAKRMLRYILDLYDLLDRRGKFSRYPFVFPLLLYNGERKWTAATNFADLVDVPEALPELKKYVPQFCYFSIIENSYSASVLEQIGNMVSSVFMLENSDEEHLIEVLLEAGRKISAQYDSRIDAFLTWLNHYLEKHATREMLEKGLAYIKSEHREVPVMLEKTLDRLFEKARRDGLQSGYLEGRQQGTRDGMQEGLQKGIKKGIQKGIQKGMHRKAIETARVMILKGYDISTISEITGLSEEEIRGL